MNLFLRDLIVYIVLVILVLFITKQNNLWGNKKGTTKTKVDVRKAKEIANKRNRYLWVLTRSEFVFNTLGFKPGLSKLEKYKFNINRGHLVVPYVDRNITPEELIGLFKIIKFFFCFLGVFLSIITGLQIFLSFFLILFLNSFFESIIEYKIMEEDKEIEKDFPDLYMILYSRLVRGTKTRLAPTLDDYVKSIDSIYGESSHKAMKRFVLDLRKNIEIYGDDSMAVHKMRDIYKSAMLINFFNLAIQSLRGVDNKDKLLAFKMELSQKKLDIMTAKANLMVSKGQKAVMLIFIILAEFVILSWVAKAGLSFMQLG